MRIIAGEARGRRLFAPEGMDTRPTSDRVREALFSIIARDVPDACVLDLFAGSGALSLEALSRGAARATIVDKSPRAMAVIRRNVELMRVKDRVRMLTSDWKTAVARLESGYTLVMLDPPYAMTGVYAEACRALLGRSLLRPGALVVMEHAAALKIEDLPDGLVVEDERRYRDTGLTLCRYRPGEERCV